MNLRTGSLSFIGTRVVSGRHRRKVTTNPEHGQGSFLTFLDLDVVLLSQLARPIQFCKDFGLDHVLPCSKLIVALHFASRAMDCAVSVVGPVLEGNAGCNAVNLSSAVVIA